MLLIVACKAALEVSPSKTEEPQDSQAPSPTVTWHQDIAPILARNCTGCHTTGGTGPFPLDTYSSAASLSSAIVDAVEKGRMPPWDAVETESCTPRFGWKNDLRLSEEEKNLLQKWLEEGSPEGDPTTAAEIPEPPSEVLEGANQEITPVKAYTTSGNKDQYICFSMDPGLTEDGWLTGVQVIPGNTEVVHHVLLFTDPEGASAAAAGDDGWYDCFGASGVSGSALLTAWVPGSAAFEVQEGSAMQVTAGSRLIAQIHYHPAGATGAEDLTTIQLRWSEGYPSSLTYLSLLGNAWSASSGLLDGPNDRYGVPEFWIPAGATDHTESMQLALEGLPEVELAMVGAHMHYIGTNMRIWLERGEPEEEEPVEDCLLESEWDFNWQRLYYYEPPEGQSMKVRGSDTLHLECTYNNTLDNPGVQTALEDAGLTEPQDVSLGEETLDEMCLGIFGIVWRP
jgi:hypothetical protein